KGGQGGNRNGANGESLLLPVPDGTVVKTPGGEVLADLVGAGTRFVAAAGGRGGLGNAALASPRRKAPGFALLGEPGEVADHVLDCATLEPGRDPLTDLDVLDAELAAYRVDPGMVPLLERPRLVVLNKVDVPDGKELAELVRPDLEARGLPVFEVSAVSHEGL